MSRISRSTAIFSVLVCTALGTGIACALRTHSSGPDAAQIGTPDGPLPSVDSPEVRAALAQARDLIGVLRENDWKFNRAPMRLLRLPGQANAEYPEDRRPWLSSFSVTRDTYPYEDVAVFSRTYVRDNIRHGANDGATRHPSGFYIVGYRNGTVTTVPVEQVTKQVPMTIPGAGTVYGFVFPPRPAPG